MLGPDHGLWFRYTLLHGVVCEAATWGVLFARDAVQAAKRTHPLAVKGPVFELTTDPEQRLDASGAVGGAGPITWRLAFDDRARRCAHVPSALFRLGISSRDYRTVFADLRCSGTVRSGDRTFEVQDAPGVLGHIYGRRHGLHDWAWCHCNAFADGDAVFEGISARLPVAGRASPPLTSLALWLDGQRRDFSLLRSSLLGRSRYGGNRWSFRARSGAAVLEGEAELAPASVALARYTDTDGSSTWCRNSRLSELRLRLLDPPAGIDRTLRSTTAAFEIGSRERPTQDPHL